MLVVGIDPDIMGLFLLIILNKYMDNEIAIRAYIAGIIDGEGYIGIRRRRPTKARKSKAPEYWVRVCVAMTDEAPVQLIANFCDLKHQIISRQHEPYKPQFIIDILREKAVYLLHEVYPFLLGKKNQADIAFELHELRQHSREHRTKVCGEFVFASGIMKGHTYRVFGTSDEYVTQCDKLYKSLLKYPDRKYPEVE